MDQQDGKRELEQQQAAAPKPGQEKRSGQTPDGNLLAVVVPCYNEEESLPHFAEVWAGVEREVAGFFPRVEYVLVNDGSADGTPSRATSARRPGSSRGSSGRWPWAPPTWS